MLNFPLRCVCFRRQPQPRRRSASVPPAPQAITGVRSSGSLHSDRNPTVGISCAEKKRSFHRSLCLVSSRRRLFAEPFDGRARWPSATAQVWADGGASRRGGRIAAGFQGSKRRGELLGGYGCAQEGLHGDAREALGRSVVAAEGNASRGQAAECVEEEDGAKTKNDDTALSHEDVTILTTYATRHNFVRVVEVSRNADSVLAGARVLLLDKPGNVHSIYQKYRVLTEAYYDIMAALPAVIPEGPIGILGLGAGTAARLIHHFWPELDMHGWELDPGVVQAARNFFDLEELEWKAGESDLSEKKEDAASGPPVCRKRNSTGAYGLWRDESDEVKLSLFHEMGATSNRGRHGRLRVHVGDALQDPEVDVEGGFAGLIVDLFSEGAVISPLQEVELWRQMREKLRPGGRIMVNCGGSCVEAAGDEVKDGAITMKETIAALAEAFPGELSIASLRDHGDNSMALTGPPPDFQLWRDTLPECLRRGFDGWRVFSPS